METPEVVTRVIAILTETAGWVGEEESERGDDDQGLALVGDLVNSLVSVPINVSDDASPQEVTEAIGQASGQAIFRAMGAFAAAFHQLAHEHDRHDPEITSVDVLRAMALRVNGPEMNDM